MLEKYLKTIEWNLMINWFCLIIDTKSGYEIVTLEKMLEEHKKFRDKKELEKVIKNFENMIDYNKSLVG